MGLKASVATVEEMMSTESSESASESSDVSWSERIVESEDEEEEDEVVEVSLSCISVSESSG